VLVGGFDLRAQAEFGIWWRLLESAGLADRSVIYLFSAEWTDKDLRLARAVLPRSLHDRLRLVADEAGAWRDLIEPDRPERSFAAIVRGPEAELLVIGPPTEDVWERFERLAFSP
jgi:hypothetical protein